MNCKFIKPQVDLKTLKHLLLNTTAGYKVFLVVSQSLLKVAGKIGISYLTLQCARLVGKTR